jgi:MSHA biogenesis protein MshJ
MNKWQQFQTRINALSLRERVLVCLAVVAVLFVIWSTLLLAPQHARRNALNLEMQAIQQKFDAQTQELTVLAALSRVASGGESARELAALEKENDNQKHELSELVDGFAPADELLSVLQDVLEQSGKLTIRRIESLPPEELRFSIPGSSGVVGTSGVLKHTVVLKLESNYQALYRYLRGLEGLPWRFYWDSLSYTVSGYPLGIIELRVSTLTMEDALVEH